MMPIDRLILLAEKLPPSWRGRLWNSPVRPVVRRLVDLLFRRHLTIVPLARPLEGHRMRLNWQMQASYGFGTYEPEVVRTVQSVVRPGWVAVDIGANIGYFTLLLAKLVGPQGRVIVFEPLPENFDVLRENVDLNGYRNVILEPKAVLDTPGSARLYRQREHLLTGTASVVQGQGVGLRVPAVSLDAYLDAIGERVNFVKIDVEGAEAAVLEGMRRILAEDAPIVLVELHDALSEQNPSLMALRRSGYEIRVLHRPPGSPVVHVLAERRRPCGSPC
jgi:FkbM family methyltransferase